MHLPTMVDLVFEQMGEHAQARVLLGNFSGDGHPPSEPGIPELLAISDQAQINLVLFAHQFGAAGKGLFILEKHIALRMRQIATHLALKSVDVEPVARQDVIEGGLDARKKAHPPGLEIALAQLGAGLAQTVIGPGVLVGHGQ
ncbi:hypothetical protein D3C75_1116390 [compost metagenome]